ncbi:MAG: Maf family protein [Sphingosinicella sp.]|nr:Maf family protein [Sphingosinicella sp.]
MKLLLASKSKARRAMLEAAGVPFGVVDSVLDEERIKADLREQGLGAMALAAALAEAKALAVPAGDDLVIGADQMLERSDGTMLDKPRSRDDALAQLLSLGGKTHFLHSAAIVAERGQAVWRGSESVALTMRPLGTEFLNLYLDEEYEAIRWGVGGYRIEGPGVQLFERIEGSHFAILGLPLLPLLAFLRERGVMAN